ncbi:MAG: PAC2 family protein [Phycisphaeraceae bacterium]|nr:PAC2 family protein [Phycisphaeraceae bacterium]
MAAPHVNDASLPFLEHGRMVLAFSGWMDGGDVSTGTVECLIAKLDAQPLAELNGEHAYLWSFPGPMEVSALFRPLVTIENGLITHFQAPASQFYICAAQRLVLFAGREPNFGWGRYAQELFGLAQRMGIERFYFIGSIGGAVPHTREPRLFGSVSDEEMKKEVEKLSPRFLNYEGPASIASYLCRQAQERGLGMASLVAEIPAYIQGRNVRCIESMSRRIGAFLGLALDLEDLRQSSDEQEKRLGETVAERQDLAELIAKLESDYDNEIFNTEMGDFKVWLEQHGLRLD